MSALWRAGLGLALILVFAFVVAAPPERCPTVTPAELRRSAQASVDWFVRNQNPEGSWLYEYNADSDTVSAPADYNWVRHAGATMGLYQAAAAGLPGALRSADRGVEWALDRPVGRVSPTVSSRPLTRPSSALSQIGNGPRICGRPPIRRGWL